MIVTARQLERPTRLSRTTTSPVARSTAIGPATAVIASTCALMAMLFAPLLSRGTVLLLDYADVPLGPHAALGPNAWGFPPGLTSRVPITTALLLLFRAIPFGQITLLPLVAFVPVAAFGFFRLLERRALATVAATALFVVNPFTYDRAFAGQVYFLIGYALLPLVLSLATTRPSARMGVWVGLVFALQAALSIHFVFITTVLLMCILCLGRGRFGERIRMLMVVGLVALVASAYWLIPIASQAGELARVTLHDVGVFRTRADPAFGLLPNLLGLHGFWRETWALKAAVPTWPLFTIGVFAVALVGACAPGDDRTRRRIVFVAAAVGLVLACGASGSLRGGFFWAFEHVPGFRIMREPHKFLALYALSLAWGFGLGVERLVQQTRSYVPRLALASVLLVIPVAASFPMLWGFWGAVRPSTFPASWTNANRIMGSGPERVLAVPGDAYASFPWTQDRAVANPMVSFFSRDVITNGNLELGGLESQTADATSRYLSYVMSVGSQTSHFGNLVAPLGVRFVVLSQTEDWARYSWLFQQTDLRVVHRWPGLVLFENVEQVALAYQPASTITVADWGEVVGLADSTRLTSFAILVRNAAPGPIRVPDVAAASGMSPVTTYVDQQVELTASSVTSSRPLVIARAYDEPWSSSSGPVSANLGLGILVRSPGSPTTRLFYARWPSVRNAYYVSTIALSVLLVTGINRRLRSRTTGAGSDPLTSVGSGIRSCRTPSRPPRGLFKASNAGGL